MPDPMLTRRRSRWSRPSMPLTVVTVLVSAIFVIPVLWLLAGSLRPGHEIFESLSPLSWDILIPSEVTLENYQAMLFGPFGRALVNSLIVCVISVAVGTVMCALAAYAVAVLKFPGRGIIFTVIVVGFMIPFEAVAIPLSQQFSSWGLANTITGLVLPGIGNGLAIFNLRQHFLSVPASYREAAKIDGASEPRIFTAIYWRLGGGALVNSALLIFLGQWGAFLWPLLVVSERDLQVAPVALAQTFGEHSSSFGQHFAGAVILSIIPALLMFILQKSFGGLSIASGEK
ncbi:carbohydrate ABC transporter permease [Microbacterium sp. A82]|uniref:carbohydrate ABC transporter permease n=1 Tax=Microbacterium sp. A82 TaxID=3450452 RepID=UPI003F2F8C18